MYYLPTRPPAIREIRSGAHAGLRETERKRERERERNGIRTARSPFFCLSPARLRQEGESRAAVIYSRKFLFLERARMCVFVQCHWGFATFVT